MIHWLSVIDQHRYALAGRRDDRRRIVHAGAIEQGDRIAGSQPQHARNVGGGGFRKQLRRTCPQGFG